MAIDLTIEGARVLRPGGWQPGPLSLSGGLIRADPGGRRVDLSGYLVLPGIVDVHGDGFERHMAPRRGALREAEAGVVACAAELAANGITTAVMAQFFSWEGGMRGPDFAEHVFACVNAVAAFGSCRSAPAIAARDASARRLCPGRGGGRAVRNLLRRLQRPPAA